MSARMTTPTEIAQAQLDAYNAQDLDAFCRCFADDVVIADLNGAVSVEGMAALRARYAKLFTEFPENRAELLGRFAIARVVVDHEQVLRSAQVPPFEIAAIYTIEHGKIARVDFVRP